MKITPTTLTLQQFFSVGNEQFLIPAYQRRYAWGQRQQRELFDDLRLLTSGDTHLLGTVLFLSDTHKPGINQLELVDGQQRVTTITILMRESRSCRLRMMSCAFCGSFQIEGSSDLAFSSARRRSALSQSKMPPQQSNGLLHVVD